MGDMLANLRHRIPLVVVLTGGEPMLQAEQLIELVGRMPYKNWHLETNGTLPVPDDLMRMLKWVTVSPKPPDYLTHVSRCHEVKIVVTCEADFEAAEVKSKVYSNAVICLQPRDNDPDLTAWCIEYLLSKKTQHQWWRLSTQVHKFIGVR
jgi:organic radical activating enzyme